MKAILLSIRPEHALNILNGKKTLELRKRVPKDFVGWVYVCVTKGKRLSVVHDDEIVKTYYYLNSNWGRSLNQDIPFRFWFDEYEEIKERFNGDEYVIEKLDELCLSDYEVKEYLGGKQGYAWHIKKLEIFDKPMQLSEFAKPCKTKNQINKYWVHKAPQSYQYVWVKE